MANSDERDFDTDGLVSEDEKISEEEAFAWQEELHMRESRSDFLDDFNNDLQGLASGINILSNIWATFETCSGVKPYDDALKLGPIGCIRDELNHFIRRYVQLLARAHSCSETIRQEIEQEAEALAAFEKSKKGE